MGYALVQELVQSGFQSVDRRNRRRERDAVLLLRRQIAGDVE